MLGSRAYAEELADREAEEAAAQAAEAEVAEAAESMRIYKSMRAKPVAAQSSHSAERRGCSSPRSARYSLVHSRQRLMVQISFAMGPSPLKRRTARECRSRLYARAARGKGRLEAIIENQPRILLESQSKCSFVDV